MENNYNISKSSRDFIEDLKEYVSEYCFDEEMRKAEQRVINRKDPELSYLFALTFKEADVNAHADVVIESNDEVRIDDFVCDIPNFDVKHFEDRIIELGNLQVLLNFARHMQEKANISRISSVIIASGDAKYNYFFAKDVKGVDIKAHGQAVLDSGNPKFCYTFARDIDTDNYIAYERVLLSSRDPKWCYYFMRDIEGANKRALEQVIINSRDPEYNYWAAQLDGAQIDVHKEIVMNSGNEDIISRWNNTFDVNGLKLIKK